MGTTEGYKVIRKDKNDVVTTCDEIPVGLYIQGDNFETNGIATDDSGSVAFHGKHHTLMGDTFSITAASDANQGDEADIVVFLKEAEKDRMTVTFGTEPVMTDLAPPSAVMANVDDTDPGDIDVMVTWMPGANAVGHLVFLFTSDFVGAPMVGVPTGNSHTFEGVAAGTYVAVVVSYTSVTDTEYVATPVTVGN